MASPNRQEITVAGQTYEARCLDEGDPSWRRCEEDLDAAGIPRPLAHRRSWLAGEAGTARLVEVRRPGGPCLVAFPVQLTRTRAAPGHRIARADELGPCAEPQALAAALVAFARMFSSSPRILRLELAVRSRDPAIHDLVAEVLPMNGFRRLPEPRSYFWTSILDLTPSEEEIFAGLHRTARRHVRAVDKRPVRLEFITSLDHVAAMDRLVEETRRRTGGDLPGRSLHRLVELAQCHPDLITFVGLFAEDDGRLLSFACARYDGDHGTYADAASTRDREHRFPLGYGPLWALIRWSKARGATWFDLGGITEGTHDDEDDRLGGISDFKRYFQGEVRQVGGEWLAEPHVFRAALASRLSEAADWLRRRRANAAVDRIPSP